MEITKKMLRDNVVLLDIGYELSGETQLVTGLVEFDIENQARFVEVVNAVLDEGVVNIFVSMALVSYIDSSGLWALFETYKKSGQKNGKMVLLNPTKDVRRVLDITKMSTKIPIVTTEQEALDILQ